MSVVRKIRHFFKKYFITGMLVIIPVWATYYVLSALLTVIDGMLGDLPERYIGFTFPGMGVITLLLLILLVGILSANFIGRRFVKFGDSLVQRVPFARWVYSTVKKVIETFSLKQSFRSVVLVEYPRKGSYSVGFVTGEVPGETLGRSGAYQSVFVPTTPNPTSGFLIILPADEITQLDIPVEQGMQYIISVGFLSLSDVQAGKLKQAGEGVA